MPNISAGVKNATTPMLIAAIIGEAIMSGEVPPSIVELLTMTQAELFRYWMPREDRCRDFVAELAERTHGRLGALASKKLYQIRGPGQLQTAISSKAKP